MATYYVDNTLGLDANPGTEALPWKTLTKVQNYGMVNGDIILFKRGETWTAGANVAGAGTGMLHISTPGITLSAYGSGAKPVFNGLNTYRIIILLNAAAINTTTRNLKLYNAGVGTGALWQNGGTGGTNTIEDCELDLHSFDACATSEVGAYTVMRRCELSNFADDGFTCHGLNGTGSGVEMYNCIIRNGFDGLNHSVTNGGDISTLCEDCVFYSNSGRDVGGLDIGNHTFNRCRFGMPGKTQSATLVQMTTEYSITFNYCIFDATMATSNATPGISLSTTTNDKPLTFNNCVFRGNSSISGFTGTANVFNGDTITFKNCIFQYWFRACFNEGAGFAVAQNCIFNNVNIKALTTNSGEITGDPKFYNPTGGDFRLHADSLGIKAGIILSGSGVSGDFANRLVRNPPDVGVYDNKLNILDRFTTTLSVVSGLRTGEPLNNSMNALSFPAGAIISVSAGKLSFTRPTAGQAYASYGIVSTGAIPRENGLTCYGKVSSSIIDRFTFGFAATSGLEDSATQSFKFVGATTLSVGDYPSSIVVGDSITASTDYHVATVCRANGALFFISGGTQYPRWNLLWVGQTAPLVPEQLWPQLANFNAACTLDDFTVKVLEGVFSGEYDGTSYFSPLVTSGETITAKAEALQYITWTPRPNEFIELQARRTDDNNCWGLRCAQSGGLRLFERSGSSEIERGGSQTQTWNTGTSYRIGFRHQGTEIRTFVDKTLKHAYTGAVFNRNVDGAKISGGFMLANWEVWPWAWSGTSLDTLIPSGSTISTRIDANKVVLVTDLHVSSIPSGLDPTKVLEARAFANHINSMKPAMVINLGDNKEIFGSSQNVNDFKTGFHDVLVGPHYFLRGNHDEDYDTDNATGSFTGFNAVFPSGSYPYRFAVDWSGAKVKFICPHTYILHTGSPNMGYGAIDSDEISWVSGQLNSLEAGWKAIVGSHFPLNPTFGNEIHADAGGNTFRSLIAANSGKIACYINGHRHFSPGTNTLSGVIHFNAPMGSYWTSWGEGGFTLMDYNPEADTITMQSREGRNLYGQYGQTQPFDIAAGIQRLLNTITRVIYLGGRDGRFGKDIPARLYLKP